MIIRWALTNATALCRDESKSVSRKDITCYYWKEGALHGDYTSMLQRTDNHAENLKNLVACWLMVNQDEYQISRGVSLLSATISSFNDEAFLTFSHTIFDREFSIFQKTNLVESLLKTVRDASLPVRSILFFVGDKSMVDNHLDFSCAWPVDGFLFES